ncbi:MFS transporter [Allorhizobium sp. BGMRC 0089]|uniref:MFS transporter n=1 Tax=Allorhizobium sonneratiae TaxID=2934936 RepID=UPI00203470A7|nr:MFS transporter [Allorhizobium sonneratiae]MCM2293315.1 MFS transporter [Allorhizobium sonneratiae]
MFFDWAAQPFFTVVTTFIFGPYFVSRFTHDPVSAQTAWSNAATVASLFIALLSPVLGAIADRSGARKPWIAFFATIKIICLLMLWQAAPGTSMLYPLVFFSLASIAAEFSIVFNDSMMPSLVPATAVGRISNTAWGLGYLGGMIVLITVVLFLAANPETGKTLLGLPPLFGLDPKTGEDARITGPIAAIWYFLFILPMFLFTPDHPKGERLAKAVRAGIADLAASLGDVRRRPGIVRFLLARMVYQDGVNGVLILGGVFAAGMFGWSTMEIGIYGIILNVVAIFGCLAASRLDGLFGSKVMVIISLVLLLTASVGIVSTGRDFTAFGLISLPVHETGGLFSTYAEKAYILYGVLIGLAFGPVQASSRSYLARSITPDEAGRYFGIYALSGRATSFMATLSFSLVTAASGSARAGMAMLILFLGGGLLLLLRTPYPANRSA